MTLSARVLPVLLLTLAAGCDRGSLLPAAFLGTWLHTATHGDGSRSEHRVALLPGGGLRTELLSYGWYGLGDGTLAGYHRESGEYRIRGDSLHTRVGRTETWALHATGPNPLVRTTGRAPFTPTARIRLVDDRLVYTFVHAPLDVPVEETIVFRRER
jgi:hypothetical protein